ncbi:GNAT family N-acetyltransferase [Brevibacillus ginsengisoli]|uniref:GNAT family N-acetyltransferase n=1 Tax=Brevibacillus ginsengisoli TaxID=363854 RepID=UPI003CF7E90C
MTKIIETNRLIFRRYTEDDIDSLFRILSDPITMGFWPSPFSYELVSSWIKRNLSNYQELGFGRWAVILKESGELIGDCGITRSDLNGTMENDLGYIIDHNYWNRGYAFEAANACKNYAFEQLKLERLCANMPINHSRSKNVALKIGMNLEKVFINHRNRDIQTYLLSIEV